MKYVLLFLALTSALFAGPIAGTSATVEVGKTVTLTVTATGTPPFTYAWTRNSWPNGPSNPWTLNGTGASVLLNDTGTPHESYHYQCKVTNSAGSSLSNEVLVTVIPHQPTAAEIEAERIRQLVIKEKAAAVQLGIAYDEASRVFGAPLGLTAAQAKTLAVILGL